MLKEVPTYLRCSAGRDPNQALVAICSSTDRDQFIKNAEPAAENNEMQQKEARNNQTKKVYGSEGLTSC